MEVRVDRYEAVILEWTGALAVRTRDIATLQRLLAGRGVRHGIDEARLAELIAYCGAAPLRDVVVARSRKPVEPVHSTIEHRQQVGDVVVPDDILAEKRPGTPGTPGMSVTGEEIPVDPLRDPPLEVDEKNVRLTPDGRIAVSLVYGVVSTQGNHVAVQSLVRKERDLMSVKMDVYPRSDAGMPVTLGIVKAALGREGVVFGIDEAAVLEAVSRADAQDCSLQDVVVARGRPPVHGVGAECKFHFRIMGLDPPDALIASRPETFDPKRLTRCLVRKGKVLATRKPAVQPVGGINVLGDKIAAREARTLVIEAGEGVELVQDGATFRCAADPIGYASFDGEQIAVESPLSISEDLLEVRARIHPPDFEGNFLNERLIDQLLAVRGIQYGVAWRTIRELTDQARRGDVWVEGVVARGQPPQRGADATLEYHFARDKKVGTVRPDGTIDYRERSVLQNASAGQALVTRTPPTAGTPGRNVLGNQMPAVDGLDAALEAGEGVERTADGLELRAVRDGVVLLEGESKVGVHDLYEVKGDVDFSTGNVRFDAGAVRVQGSIRSTFDVAARSHVLVGNAIGDSQVVSMGDVEAQRGIVHKLRGLVRAGGSVHALFAQNATIEAGRDICIRQSAINCQLTAGGKIEVIEGKGRIIGGRARAGEGVVANDLGSEMCIETEITVGRQWQRLEALEAQARKLRHDIREIEKTIGENKSMEDFYTFPLARQEVFRKILGYVQAVREELERIDVERREIVAGAAEGEDAQVTVLGTAHPGVTICMLQKRLKVNEPGRNVVFYYDHDNDEIGVKH